VLTNQAVIDQLWQIKKTKGWKIGLSLSGVEQGDTLMIALGIKNDKGDLLFDSVQATYNVLECSSGPALTEASEAGLQVIVKEGMANGRVFKSGNTGPSSSRLSTLHTEAEAIGCTVDALALACIIVQPFSPMVLSGAACIEHMCSNADACGLVADGKVIPPLVLHVLFCVVLCLEDVGC
jgi:aryl-alcohol dehydrogenase-like predicted oxidoreductase